MFRNSPIKLKLIGSILVTSGTVLLLTCGTFLAYELITFRQAMVSNLSTLARVVVANSTAALAFDNARDATDVLAALSAETHVVRAGLYNTSGVLFATFPSSAPKEVFPSGLGRDGYEFSRTRLTLHQAVVNRNQRLGTLFVESDLGALYARLALYGALMGGILILSFLVALPLSNHLQRDISRPVLELVRTATAVAGQRDYSARAARFGDDELGRLTDVFNAMLGQIQAQDTELRAREEHLRHEIADRTRAEAEVLTLNANLERHVHERTEALEVANQELEAFSYTVSHDLRAPLRHIHGYSEMLKRATSDSELSDKAKRYVSTIIAASTEMGVLIDDLLAFSRMGRAEIRSFEVSLSELVTETVLGLELALKDRQIVWQIAPLPPAMGDRALLKQLLANLIGNAVKYTRMREQAHIDIGCAGEEDGRMILFVRDNGAGFDPQYAHKLFGVFQRLHRAEEFEGSGIGLATVRRITTRHGGRVWAEGALNEGATFYFTLQTAAASA